MELKIVINDPKQGKSYKTVMPENLYINKKIGDKIAGEDLGLQGYELQITGGSDSTGFGMRADLPITGKKKLLLTGGVGIHLNEKGMQKRKTVAGAIVSNLTASLNMKIVKHGSKSVEDCLGIQPKEEKAEE